MRRFLKIVGPSAVLMAALALVRCNPALTLAPPGTSITLIPNPCSIAASGGVAVIAAVLTESTGVPVADGTVVQFFTDLGTIDRQGKTNDGVARVNLVADGRSGSARVTALSGSGAGSATPEARTSGAGVVRLQSRGVVQASAVDVHALAGNGGCTSTGSNGSASTSVAIGGINVGRVLLVASPPNVSPGRTALLTATVLDANGNPVPNVPVFFTLDTGTGSESLASGGTAVFTDNNGQALDVLSTTAVVPGGVSVTAHAGGSLATTGLSVSGGAPPRPTASPTDTPTPTSSPRPTDSPTPRSTDTPTPRTTP